MKLHCIELLRLLYRSELKDFIHWGVDLLVTQLQFPHLQAKTLEVIQEISTNSDMMKKVVQRCPNHLHLAKSKFLVQLLRIPEGFHYLTHIKNYTLYET